MNKKTLLEWEASNLDLDEYLTEPCEIDEDLYNYLGECTTPQYHGEGLLQSGESTKEEEGVAFYMSAMNVDENFFYLGELPEFMQ